MTGEAPKLVEHNTDSAGNEYQTQWFCDPPPPEVPFRLVRDEWTYGDHVVHRIYEIALDEADPPKSRPARVRGYGGYRLPPGRRGSTT
jgi:hypothetical protein